MHALVTNSNFLLTGLSLEGDDQETAVWSPSSKYQRFIRSENAQAEQVERASWSFSAGTEGFSDTDNLQKKGWWPEFAESHTGTCLGWTGVNQITKPEVPERPGSCMSSPIALEADPQGTWTASSNLNPGHQTTQGLCTHVGRSAVAPPNLGQHLNRTGCDLITSRKKIQRDKEKEINKRSRISQAREPSLPALGHS